jgi:hypothetical protein
MSDYTTAPATILLATNCVCCGRPLVDACSVELGIGPECRNGVFPEDVDEADRQLANEHVHHAAIAAQNGHAQKVVEYAELIRKLGFVELADKVERRFKEGVVQAERKADITIEEKEGYMLITTPYRRGDAEAFKAAWRAIPGRKYIYKRKANEVPVAQKVAVWELLQKFFPGKWGVGPKGAFRVPTAKKVEEPVVDAQPELDWELDANIDDTIQAEIDAESAAHAAEFEMYN